MVLDGQVDGVSDIRILTDATLERPSDGLPNKLDFHPPSRVVDRVDVFRYRTCSDFRDNPKQILVSLGHSDKATDLADLVGLALNDRQTGSD